MTLRFSFLSIILGFLWVSLFNSCCTEVYCIPIDEISEIQLRHFEAEDLDGLRLIKYINGAAVQSIDLSSSSPVNAEYQLIHLPDFIDISAEYELVNDSGDSFYISNFQSEKKKCNEGFMCRDFYEGLQSYEVNGLQYIHGSIVINKYN